MGRNQRITKKEERLLYLWKAAINDNQTDFAPSLLPAFASGWIQAGAALYLPDQASSEFWGAVHGKIDALRDRAEGEQNNDTTKKS